MKGILLVILFLAIAAVATYLGIEMRHDPGYVVINYKGWSIQTSVWATVASAIIIFIAIFIIIKLLSHLVHLPRRISNWRGRKTQRKTVQLTNLGLCELAEGRWEKAEKYLIRGIKDNDNAFFNYLTAAKAAQLQNEYGRRDKYLTKAHKLVKGSKLAVGLTQAQLEIGSKQWQKAATTLSQLHKESPKHPFVIELLSRLYLELQDWQQLKNIMPSLRKNRSVDQAVIESIESKIYISDLNQAAKDSQPQALIENWKKIPRGWRQDQEIKEQYINCLLQQECYDLAEPEIISALKQQWNASLAYKYSKINTKDLSKQLNTTESWVKKYPEQCSAYLACARVCIKLKLWGKAKGYLEESIEIQESSEAYQLLGQTFEAENEEDLAMECYRKGLKLAATHKDIAR